MTFFEHQRRARRKTGLLIFYFLLAVTLIVAAINIAAYWLAKLSGEIEVNAAGWMAEPYWRWITLGVLAVILFGSLRTFWQTRGGGRALAEWVGARRVDSASPTETEQRLIHVVEEMAIASGTPVPMLYVMDDEPAINAFVAGFKPTESVLVVTQGALEILSRDELQGVVGHEYSHILNGDTRINLRLLGILGGILAIGQLGRALLRSGSGRSRSRGRSDSGVAAIGVALFAIGYVGLFFGRLIQAAISRQREFLADASSVQFTRNPAGIAGALWRIGEAGAGSRLRSAHADDLGHFCFGQAVKLYLSSWLATPVSYPPPIPQANDSPSGARSARNACQRYAPSLLL